jgi:hypothetical protein
MAKAGKIVVAVVALVGSILLALMGALFSLLRCDEACYDSPSEWQRSEDAWQWTAIAALSIAVFVSAVAILVVVSRGRGATPWVAGWGAIVFSLLLLIGSAASN